jgi:hypothetical protein
MISGVSVRTGGCSVWEDNELSDSINGREFQDRLRTIQGELLSGNGYIFELEK